MNECKIVQDLIPLYIDDLLSEESAETVRSHAESCEECKKMLERCREPLPEAEKPDAQAYKKSLRKDRINFACKLILICVLVTVVLFVFCTRLDNYLQWKDGKTPVEQVFESDTGWDTVTVVDWDESGYFKEGSGSLFWHEHYIFHRDEYSWGVTGGEGMICVPWEDIRLEWAPNGIDFIVTARLVEGGTGIFIFDEEDLIDEEGRQYSTGERYPRDYNGPGLSEVLIPLCQAHSDFPTGWETVEFTFFRWSDDSECITFVYELDDGTRGFLEYEYKTETILSVE